VYYLSQPRDLRTLILHRLDPASGEVTTVLSETGTTRVEPNQWMNEPPIVRVLADEVLWYSQRDGWATYTGMTCAPASCSGRSPPGSGKYKGVWSSQLADCAQIVVKAGLQRHWATISAHSMTPNRSLDAGSAERASFLWCRA
jgi:hypothetical protein